MAWKIHAMPIDVNSWVGYQNWRSGAKLTGHPDAASPGRLSFIAGRRVDVRADGLGSFRSSKRCLKQSSRHADLIRLAPSPGFLPAFSRRFPGWNVMRLTEWIVQCAWFEWWIWLAPDWRSPDVFLKTYFECETRGGVSINSVLSNNRSWRQSNEIRWRWDFGTHRLDWNWKRWLK